MTDDTPPLVERAAGLDADLTASETLALAYLAATDGPHTRQEVSAATGVTGSAVLPALRDLNLVTRHERETDRGRNPYVYALTPETRATLDTESPAWDDEAIQPRLIRELAECHYCRGLSSATAKQLAREIPGASVRYVAGRLGYLASDDGPVEVVKRETPARYRLVGAGLFTPYQALPQAATDGGTDR